MTSANGTAVSLNVSANTSFTVHGVTLSSPALVSAPLTGPVTAVYNNKQTPFVASQVMVNITMPIKDPMGNPPNGNMAKASGNITALSGSSMTIATSSGPVTLNLNGNTNFTIHGVNWLLTPTASLIGLPATAVYNNKQTPLVASQVMINMPNQTTGPLVAPRNSAGWFGGPRGNGKPNR
jgi:hypothetical protein